MLTKLLLGRPTVVWHGLSVSYSARHLSTGQSFGMSRVITQEDVDTFVRLTGDSNPIHSTTAADGSAPNSKHAADKAVIVPGMLMASMFPAIIGSSFPGALYLSQTLKFRRSAAVGTPVHATVTVSKLSGSRVTFDTVCRDSEEQVLVDGTALALINPKSDPTSTTTPDAVPSS
jgi:3-hydroxybutyryl-CoA dehydratase